MNIHRWFLKDSKLYKPETKKWYCISCFGIMPIERNPAWSGLLRGDGEEPEWIIRCAECGDKIMDVDYDCPECGWPHADESSAIAYGPDRYNLGAAMEYGGNPVDWEETHRCPECETEFTFTNSNC